MIPGPVPEALARALDEMGVEGRDAFVPHLLGGTSADYLADWLERAGLPCRATTIKRYRREVLNAER